MAAAVDARGVAAEAARTAGVDARGVAVEAARTAGTDPHFAARASALVRARNAASSPAIAEAVDELAVAMAAAREPGGTTERLLGDLAAQQRRFAALDRGAPGAPASNDVWGSLQAVREATTTTAVDLVVADPAGTLADVERIAAASKSSAALADALDGALAVRTAPLAVPGAIAPGDLRALADSLRTSASIDGTYRTSADEVAASLRDLEGSLRTAWQAAPPQGNELLDTIAANVRHDAATAMVGVRRGIDQHAANGWVPFADYPDQGTIGRLAAGLDTLAAARAVAPDAI